MMPIRRLPISIAPHQAERIVRATAIVQPGAKVMNRHPTYPDVLVETSQVGELIGQPGIRLIEVDLDTMAYDEGHIESTLLWSWNDQLRVPATHQIPSKDQVQDLLRASGISNEDTIILYGDNRNWFACWGFWLLKLYGHERVLLIDGGARKWFAEGRQVTTAIPEVTPSNYIAKEPDLSNKASIEDVFRSFFDPTIQVLDVRSPPEYDGRSLGPAGVKANSVVPGHIPAAINVPWQLNCNPDGTFRSPEELAALYEERGITPSHRVITYCAIGERASLSWFVLKHLLKHNDVMNYDRSMAEWSRMPNAPIVTGEAA